MATTGGGMAILPQYQGNYYDLQRQQALAQALTQNALSPQMPQATGSGQYTVMPKYTALQGLSQLGSALLAARTGQNASQGMNDLGMQQWAALTGGNPAMGMGASGGSASPLQSAPAGQPGVDDGSAGAGGVSGSVSQAAPAQGQGMLSPGGAMNPIGMPAQQAAMMYLNSPDKYWEAQAAAYKPADVVSQMRAAGIDPSSALGKQIAQQALAKANYIAPTSLRPGGYAVYADGREEQLPQVPEGFTAVRGQNGWQIVPVQGGQEAMTASSVAKAAGPATFQTKEVWDPTANGGQGGMVLQTATNAAQAAGAYTPSGNAPAPMRNNNPGAMMPGGKMAAYPDMQTGLAAMDSNLASYGKQGVNTLSGVISKWAPPNENDTKAYISDVSQRLGISPNQQIDLTNPAVRQALGTAIMIHENGPQGVFGGGAQGQSGPMAAQPPLGATNAANASQAAPSKQMADAYSAMSTADANYQQSREALQEMMGLANQKGASGTAVGLLPSGIGTKISPDAAKYQKLHATYVALQGKALGSGGTDAARATIDEAVPTYDKPQSAMTSGLQTQLTNLDMGHLKTQFLTPLYQQGNEKAFTQQSAAFDQNVKPSMMPALQMSGDAQRAAVQAAIKANPSLRPNFEWAFNNGMLK